MAITTTLSNHYKYQRDIGNINLSSDVLKFILMNTSFVFDKDAHATLADVTANQLATGNGYTQDDITLTGGAVSEDDANDRSSYTADNVTVTASGGDIGPTGSAIVYDDTTPDDTVVGCVDYGEDHTIFDGSSLQFQTLEIRAS
jgi:hypothetical protein